MSFAYNGEARFCNSFWLKNTKFEIKDKGYLFYENFKMEFQISKINS